MAELPRPAIAPSVLALVRHAHLCLAESAAATRAADRYVAAHLGALRAAAAVLAARPDLRRTRGPSNVWRQLARVAPELGEWAAFFSTSAQVRAKLEAGLLRAVTDRAADDLLRDAEAFLDLVTELLGLPHQRSLHGVVAPLRAS